MRSLSDIYTEFLVLGYEINREEHFPSICVNAKVGLAPYTFRINISITHSRSSNCTGFFDKDLSYARKYMDLFKR